MSSVIKKFKSCNLRNMICIVLLVSSFTVHSQTEPKKVFIHYMGWFGDGIYGRHWICGQAHRPLIGYYNSQNWSTEMYQILISWSCGIDGLIINVKDDYDAQTSDQIIQTIRRIRDIDSVNFKYNFTISYDDQGMSDIVTAETKFTYLRDHILTEPVNFLRYNHIPAIFVFNYAGQYLTAQNYNTALNAVFPANRPKLIWNEIDASALGYANSFFPWVQPGGQWNGTNWGQTYLQWFYPTIAGYNAQLDFATGGVWPGFDDRPNSCWGSSRLIERRNDTVYNSTWSFVNNYSGSLPLKWVVIETWNDWNEGTEIEPSIESGYQYLKSTITNINTFKDTTISTDTAKFEVAGKIYTAADAIEKSNVDSALYYPLLERSVSDFLQGKFNDSRVNADSINQHLLTNINNARGNVTGLLLETFPNPAKSLVQIRITMSSSSKVELNILDINGRLIETIHPGFLPAGDNVIEWNTTNLKRGMYFFLLKTDEDQMAKKIILN